MLKMKKISIWSEGKDLVVRGSEGPDDGSFEIKLVSAKQVLGPLIDGDLGGVSECMQHCAAQGHYSSAKMVIPSLPCAWGSISYFSICPFVLLGPSVNLLSSVCLSFYSCGMALRI